MLAPLSPKVHDQEEGLWLERSANLTKRGAPPLNGVAEKSAIELNAAVTERFLSITTAQGLVLPVQSPDQLLKVEVFVSGVAVRLTNVLAE